MKKLLLIVLISMGLLILVSCSALGITINGYGNYDYNTLVSNPVFEGGVALNISDISIGLRCFSYKEFPMLSKDDPAYENNRTCYLGQYYVEYKYNPFKLSFKHNFIRNNTLPSFDTTVDFTYLRDSFPTYSLGGYYIYDEDVFVLVGLRYNFNSHFMSEVGVSKNFWKFTLGAKNTTYMYYTNKGWSVSGSPICQLYEVYARLHLSDNVYVYYNDWCYHPVVSDARKSAYYNANSQNPTGLSVGINISF